MKVLRSMQNYRQCATKFKTKRSSSKNTQKSNIMKSVNYLLLFCIFFLFSFCTSNTRISQEEREKIQTEVHQFVQTMDEAVSLPDAEKYASLFSDSKDFTVASQGKLITSYASVCDTINAHLSAVKSQSIKTLDERIYVIDKNDAVVSTSKLTTTTLKNGAEVTMPYALTMLLTKTNDGWKIMHYHN